VCHALPFNVVGLNCMQLLARLGSSASMELVVSHLVHTIHALQPAGRIYLMGFSWGGGVSMASAQVREFTVESRIRFKGGGVG